MNLVGIDSVKLTYETDDILGETTITFSDSTGVTVYGTIVVEVGKHRALMDALALIADSMIRADADALMKHRVLLDTNAQVATAVFSL